MKSLMTGFAALIAALLLANAASAVQVHKNMLNSRLAEIELKSEADIRIVDEIGGIFEHYNGRQHRVWLLPEDFNRLEMLGYSVRWMTEAEIDPEGTGRRPRETLDEYHENDDIEGLFAGWQAAHPTLFSYESIGQSVQGRDLWMGKISDNVTLDEPEIEVKYISTMHGNELTGLENCLKFIDSILTDYGTEPELTAFVDDYEIFVMPLMNPDGRANGTLGTRFNANGVDLNRAFPDRVDDSTNTTAGREPEIAAVMNWSAQRNCVLSVNFHTGTIVANYPWDNNYTHQSIFSPTPENALFYHVSYVYALNNDAMFNSSEFPPDGTTNGADWYWVSGGMQDWNYVWMGCKEVTVELSDVFSGPESALDSLWDDNRISMFEYLYEAREGVRGVVTDAETGDPLRAEIMLASIPYLTYSSALHGEYYRILRPGNYSLTFSANGYASQTINSIIVVSGTPTVLNVALSRVPSPEIAVAPTSLDEVLPICDEADVEITLRNTGEASLSWSGMEADDAMSPDWTVFDSREPGGPAYDWIDISSVGIEANFTADDQNLGTYAIGFSFPFYGQNFTTYRISANGWVSFTSTASNETSYNNTSLPSTNAPENIIAGWWDDLSPQNGAAVVYYYSNGTDSLVISYIDVPSYSGGGLYDFQMILESSGQITYQYGNMGTARLTSATIGVQNSNRTLGLTVAYNQTFIENNMALRLCPGSVIELDPASGTIPASGSQIVTVHLNSCCLTSGVYETAIVFTSNDPFTPELTVPVTLDVGGQAGPDAVADLTVARDPGGIRLDWSAAAGASGYQIWRGTTPVFDTLSGSLLGTVAGTTFVDGAAPAARGFYFVISLP